MIISLTSDVYGPGRLYDAASTIMQQKLSQIQGVGQVVVGGSSLPAVRVEVNPTQLNSYGLGLEDVRTMLSVQNVNRPKGQISDDPDDHSESGDQRSTAQGGRLQAAGRRVPQWRRYRNCRTSPTCKTRWRIYARAG